MSSTTDDSDREELIAFLDGELSDADANRRQALLARDAGARAEAKALQEAWDLLDFLVIPQPTKDFTERTRTLAVASAADVDASQSSTPAAPTGRPTRTLAIALTAITFFLGATGAVSIARRPRGAIADREMLERLDDYRTVRDLTFLRRWNELAASRSLADFVDGGPSRGDKPVASPDELAGRAGELASLSALEREHIVSLHREINGAPDRAALEGGMRRFLAWNDSLAPAEKERLAVATGEDRVAAATSILDEQLKAADAAVRSARGQMDSTRASASFDPQWPSAREQLRDLRRLLVDRLSPHELSWLEGQTSAQWLTAALLFSAHHDVALSPPVVKMRDRLLGTTFSRCLPALRGFDSDDYSKLSENEKRKFQGLLAALATPGQRTAVLEYLDDVEAIRPYEFRGVDTTSSISLLVATLYYYRDHPQRQPESFHRAYREMIRPPSPRSGLPGPDRRRSGKRMGLRKSLEKGALPDG